MIPRAPISRIAPRGSVGRASAIAMLSLALSSTPAVGGGVSADLPAPAGSIDSVSIGNRAEANAPGIPWWGIARGLTVLLTVGLIGGGIAPAAGKPRGSR